MIQYLTSDTHASKIIDHDIDLEHRSLHSVNQQPVLSTLE